MDNTYKVYIMADADGKITAINSSAFLTDTADWTQIDEGSGDKYHHAQGNYFEKELVDESGCYSYKLVGGKATERTADEKRADLENLPPPPPTDAERIEALEAALLEVILHG